MTTALANLKGARVWSLLEQGIRRVFEHLPRSLVGDQEDPETLHRLRRQARRLRYAAEVSDTLVGQDSGAPSSFKDLQERLGAIHDNQVLGEWLAEVAARARARGPAA